MLTRAAFASRFASRALFGMVHLRPLPGAPLFAGSLDDVIEAALVDARALRAGGADGIVFENFGDRPFFAARVPPSTVAAMTRAIVEVVREVRLPFGVNVLRNDASSAIAIAAATGAAFIRVNVHTGAMLTDQGIIEGEAAETLRLRASLAPDVAIFADHFVKHAVPLAPLDAVQAAKDLRLRGLADALIVSGTETGVAPDAARLAMLRNAVPDAPLIIGSGLTADNTGVFAEADGAIVGTSVKEGGDVERPVDAARVAAVVTAFKASGGR
ncbi:MAG TPA: BtpA/SgcQ family protein [Thermoanaerobaculia bacterium]|nr:BtpA/SgcQ family protein [Thermoanaerobaculia bacterium]